ncbi:MAG: hypothetical protein KIT58_10220, partial [Planctomycetota bacterium]|nr:hypothetical protein [Planctomycetota bacterium]
MLERWTREQLSDGEVVLYRRWVEGCAAAVAALLVLVVAAWRHLPHSVEEFVAATILLPVILLAYLVVCRLRWRGWFALDLGREVARRAFLLGRLVDRLEHGTSRRAGQHAAVAGFLDGQPVGARVWVDPRAEAPLDALLCHVVFEGPLRCRLSPRPAHDGGPPARTGGGVGGEGG